MNSQNRSGHYIATTERQKKWEDQWLEDDIKRHHLLDAVLATLPLGDGYNSPDLWSQPLPFAKDVPHLLNFLNDLDSSTEVTRRQFVAQAISIAWGRKQEQEIFDTIAQAWQQSVEGTGPALPELEEEFNWALRPIDIRSSEAGILRGRWLKQKKQREEMEYQAELRNQKETLDPPLDERIENTLRTLEQGDIEVWIHLNYLLAFEPDGTSPLAGFHGNLQDYPGWKRATEQTRARVVNGAHVFLQFYASPALNEVETQVSANAANAGFRALYLLLNNRSSLEAEVLSPELWERWSASLVLFPGSWQKEEKVSMGVPLMLAYRFAPEAVLAAFRFRLERDRIDNNPTASLWMLEGALDDPKEALEKHPTLEAMRPVLEGFWQPGDAFSQFLVEHMERPDWEPSVFGAWLRLLLKRKVPEAENYARQLVEIVPSISTGLEETNSEVERSIVAAATLLTTAEDGGWDIVWPAFQKDTVFGCAVVERLAPISSTRSEEKLTGLSERDLANLYLWLEQQYPHDQDPNIKGLHRLDTREFIANYRDEVLGQLAGRKTSTACREIEVLVEKLPEVETLRDTLRYSRELMGREQWQPMEPASVLALQDEPMPQPSFGIVTALPHEYAAMRCLLDDGRDWMLPGTGAGRRFHIGTIPARGGGSHIVALTVPSETGNLQSASLTTKMLDGFANIRYTIMCGIAGGVPFPEKPNEHVRLGDIVVSGREGVVQYDFVKHGTAEDPGEIRHNHSPRPPSPSLLDAIAVFEADCFTTPFLWMPHVEKASRLINAPRPSEDVLHDANGQIVLHPPDPARTEGTSRVFRDTICSGGQVLRNPTRRDQLRDRFQAKAVEMEGSGLAEATWLAERGGFLIVRGTCDYCDTFKSDEWQRYAAIVAAAYVRALLESIPRDA